jgi:serine protease Do
VLLSLVAPRGALASAVEDHPAVRLAVQLQDAFALVAERVFPSVVGVTVYTEDPDWTPEKLTAAKGPAWLERNREALLYPGFRRSHAGSGVVVSADGHILTTHGNLLDESGAIARIIDIELQGDRHLLARVAGAEPTIDLGVLVVDAPQSVPLEPALLGDSDAVRTGHWAIALGDPAGAERTFAAGTIAAQPQRQCYQDDLSRTLVQSSVRVPSGSHGGPLVNIRGEVIGISVAGPAASAGDGASAYALPTNLVAGIYEALLAKGSTDSPWLGVSVLELSTLRRRLLEQGREVVLPETKYYPGTGVYIEDVFEPSPASRAGIRVGDFLVKIDGRLVFSPYDFQKWTYLAGIGTKVALELFRDGQTREVQATLEPRPAGAPPR